MRLSHQIAAFILAAGEGKRLRPATLYRPKPLMPLCGVPLLHLVLDQLAPLPLSRVVVNAWHLHEQIEADVAEYAKGYSHPLTVSSEASLLGTGGGIRHALPLLGDAEAILVRNADVVLDYDLRHLLDVHFSRGTLATMLLVPARGPLTVTMAEDGCVTTLVAPKGGGQYTFAGVHILSPVVLKYLAPTDPACIVQAYQRAIADGQPIYGLSIGDAYWTDLGTTASYIQAHRELHDTPLSHSPLLASAVATQRARRSAVIKQAITCSGAIGLGEHLALPAGTQLHNTVALDGTHLTASLRCYEAVIGYDPAVTEPPVINDARQPHPSIFATLGVAADTCQITPLRKQGSGRLYARITAGARSWIWSAYSHERKENAAFAAQAAFLDRLGIHVPRVLYHRPELGEIVCTDLGNSDLLSLKDDQAACERYLQQVIEQIARLHVFGAAAAVRDEVPMQPPYTEGFYRWESDYFREHLLTNFLQKPELWNDAVEADYQRLLAQFADIPQAPVHRDLQSANILIHDDSAYLIDFQGMRLGCPAYDLASLLYDPYSAYPPTLRHSCWARYQQARMALGASPLPDELFHAATVQRLFQALGAYGKLWLQDGNAWFREYIPPALELLGQAAEEGGFCAIAAMTESCICLV